MPLAIMIYDITILLYVGLAGRSTCSVLRSGSIAMPRKRENIHVIAERRLRDKRGDRARRARSALRPELTLLLRYAQQR